MMTRAPKTKRELDADRLAGFRHFAPPAAGGVGFFSSGFFAAIHKTHTTPAFLGTLTIRTVPCSVITHPYESSFLLQLPASNIPFPETARCYRRAFFMSSAGCPPLCRILSGKKNLSAKLLPESTLSGITQPTTTTPLHG